MNQPSSNLKIINNTNNNHIIKDYLIKDKLGEGSFGVVYRAINKSNLFNKNKDNKDQCVLKQISLFNLNKTQIDEVKHEATLLSSLNSSFIVKYNESFIDSNCLNIVMEYCEGGDLCKYLSHYSSSKLLSEDKIWSFFIQICLGIHYLHHRKILHRDLKSLNIFLTKDERIKIGDLGVAKVLSQTNFARTFVGTPYYLSPEICEEKPYNEKSDIWALGCLLYEMTTLKHPFNANSQPALILKILKGKYDPIPRRYSDELKLMIDLMLNKNYYKRPSINDILRHSVLQNRAKKLNMLEMIIEVTNSYASGIFLIDMPPPKELLINKSNNNEEKLKKRREISMNKQKNLKFIGKEKEVSKNKNIGIGKLNLKKNFDKPKILKKDPNINNIINKKVKIKEEINVCVPEVNINLNDNIISKLNEFDLKHNFDKKTENVKKEKIPKKIKKTAKSEQLNFKPRLKNKIEEDLIENKEKVETSKKEENKLFKEAKDISDKELSTTEFMKMILKSNDFSKIIANDKYEGKLIEDSQNFEEQNNLKDFINVLEKRISEDKFEDINNKTKTKSIKQEDHKFELELEDDEDYIDPNEENKVQTVKHSLKNTKQTQTKNNLKILKQKTIKSKEIKPKSENSSIIINNNNNYIKASSNNTGIEETFEQIPLSFNTDKGINFKVNEYEEITDSISYKPQTYKANSPFLLNKDFVKHKPKEDKNNNNYNNDNKDNKDYFKHSITNTTNNEDVGEYYIAGTDSKGELVKLTNKNTIYTGESDDNDDDDEINSGSADENDEDEGEDDYDEDIFDENEGEEEVMITIHNEEDNNNDENREGEDETNVPEHIKELYETKNKFNTKIQQITNEAINFIGEKKFDSIYKFYSELNEKSDNENEIAKNFLEFLIKEIPKQCFEFSQIFYNLVSYELRLTLIDQELDKNLSNN